MQNATATQRELIMGTCSPVLVVVVAKNSHIINKDFECNLLCWKYSYTLFNSLLQIFKAIALHHYCKSIVDYCHTVRS